MENGKWRMMLSCIFQFFHGCIQQHLLYRVCYDPVSVDAQSAGVVFALSVVLFGIVE